MATRIAGESMVLDDDAIVAMVRAAYLPALLVALAHATGDLSILRDDLRPDPALIQLPQGGLTDEQRAGAHELAVDVLRGLFAGGAVSSPSTDESFLRALFAFLTGTSVSDDEAELLIEELGLPGEDRRTPRWRKEEIDADRPFCVAIIGAGMSGLLAAHRLQQADVPYVVIEKNPDVGGTWYENCYPGCRVDVPNHLYSYSFLQRDDWPERFSPRDLLLDYFRDAADRLGIREHIRFSTEVLRATFREADGDWALRVREPDGRESTLHANVVVSAVGQLNRPRFPDIEGVETFAGPAFHSAEWRHDVDLRAKRVAVIGTGASAFQVIPTIAGEVAELHVYQRTPPWLMPTPDYHAPMPDGMQWLLTHVPTYSNWYRLSLFWRLAEGAMAAARVDPEWSGDRRSISARSEELRALLTRFLEGQFGDAPELLDHVVPRYPPLAKRILLDDGTWAATLKRENVELVTDAIERITPSGVVAGGRLREVDVIVYGTGFQASKFLMPMKVTGRGGVDLHEHWDGDARAYLGLTIPGFPNLLCMYGPNTNLVANGSITFFSECETTYIVEYVRALLERRARALDCRQDVHDAYNLRIDEETDRMVWGATHVSSWYRNEKGRIAQNWPGTLLGFWQQTRTVDLADYEVL